jgi:hypothetical protein
MTKGQIEQLGFKLSNNYDTYYSLDLKGVSSFEKKELENISLLDFINKILEEKYNDGVKQGETQKQHEILRVLVGVEL